MLGDLYLEFAIKEREKEENHEKCQQEIDILENKHFAVFPFNTKKRKENTLTTYNSCFYLPY